VTAAKTEITSSKDGSVKLIRPVPDNQYRGGDIKPDYYIPYASPFSLNISSELNPPGYNRYRMSLEAKTDLGPRTVGCANVTNLPGLCGAFVIHDVRSSSPKAYNLYTHASHAAFTLNEYKRIVLLGVLLGRQTSVEMFYFTHYIPMYLEAVEKLGFKRGRSWRNPRSGNTVTTMELHASSDWKIPSLPPVELKELDKKIAVDQY
jgi:hypothetical protein